MAGQTPISLRLRDRVMTGADEFSGAFDALDGSDKALSHLREAADELMRAAARALIEIERATPKSRQ
jgi:hypothetical protein